MNHHPLKKFVVAGLAAGALALVGQSAGAVSPTEPDDPEPVSTVPAVPEMSEVEELVPPPTVEPVGLGAEDADPEFDELAQQCYDGIIVSCDELYSEAEAGSQYEIYADTCAGRQPEGTGLLCVETFPLWAIALDVLGPPQLSPVGLGDDPELNALADSCYEGDVYACDQLYEDSEIDSAYEAYGDSCAGRQDNDTGLWCYEMARDAALEAAETDATDVDDETGGDVSVTTEVPGDEG